jgi:hypothetical protein
MGRIRRDVSPCKQTKREANDKLPSRAADRVSPRGRGSRGTIVRGIVGARRHAPAARHEGEKRRGPISDSACECVSLESIESVTAPGSGGSSP